jgi:drug/metabolite transporter (DMT)-like permease
VTRTTNDSQTWGLFVLLSVIWGSSYLFIKIGLEEGMSPLTLVAIRTLLGAGLLALVMRWRGGRLPRAGKTWLFMGIVGMTNIVIPYALITWGELHISSGMAGILTALTPLFTVALASFVLRDEPATPSRLFGLAVGFGGVVVLAYPSLVADSGDEWLPVLAGMVAVALASVSYAVAVVSTRKRLSGKPVMSAADGSARAPTSLEISFGSVFIGMLVITPLAVLFERPADGLLALPGSSAAIFAMIWLGLASTGVAYLLYFAIIGRWGATRATLITYVMPVVAIILGFIVLGERLQVIEVVGAALIISGVVLVNANIGRRRTTTTQDVTTD